MLQYTVFQNKKKNLYFVFVLCACQKSYKHTIWNFKNNVSQLCSRLTNNLQRRQKKQDTKAESMSGGNLQCYTSLAEPSHVPKHPCIGLEVQIQLLRENLWGLTNSVPWIGFELMVLYRNVLAHDLVHPCSCDKLIPVIFTWERHHDSIKTCDC